MTLRRQDVMRADGKRANLWMNLTVGGWSDWLVSMARSLINERTVLLVRSRLQVIRRDG
jgi:hypothetical protein